MRSILFSVLFTFLPIACFAQELPVGSLFLGQTPPGNTPKALPLLLLYGDNDMIVDKAGCDELYTDWKGLNKNYEIIPGGSHGKSTVYKGAEIILNWMGGI